MRKRILAFLLSIALVFSLCVAVSATQGDLQSVLGELDGQTIGAIGSEDGESAILYGGDAFYGEDMYTDSLYGDYADMEYLISQVGEENVGILIAAVVVMLVCTIFFTPALILLIVFAVLNGKLKKKIKECEAKLNAAAPFAPVAQPTYPVAEQVPAAQPAQDAPVDNAPVEDAPVDNAPVDNAPVEAPAEDNNDNNEGGEE